MRFSYASLTAQLLLLGCNGLMAEEKDERPNILFIMSDDHAYQAISAYGSNLIQTPNIDRLAQEGVMFNQSFVSNSICGPSRACMLTGKLSHYNGFYGNGDCFDADQMTFPKLLQKSGYQTAMIGKLHLSSYPQGFDFWRILPEQGDYYNPDFIEMSGDTVRYPGYVTDLIGDFTLEWLQKKRDKEKPFCLFYHHKAPHREWLPAPRHFELFDSTKFELPETFFDDYKGRKAAQLQEMTIATHMNLTGDNKVEPIVAKDHPTDYAFGRDQYQLAISRMTKAQKEAWDKEYHQVSVDFQNKFKDLDEVSPEMAIWKYQRYMIDYLRCIASVDENVGRVLDYLDQNGLTENTIVVYTSDQGFYLGEHGWFDKRFMYEESFRTPLLVRYPKKIKPNRVSEALVQNIDYAPTFLDYAGISIPDSIQGISLRGIFEDKQPNVRDAVYYHYYGFPAFHQVRRHYGIRTDRYKLIHFYNDIDTWELYDLEKDKNELNNLIDDPLYEEIELSLREQLQKLREDYRVPEEDVFNSKEGGMEMAK